MIKLLSGLVLCGFIAAAAAWLGRGLPLVGGAVFAILLGILFGNVVGVPERARPGMAFSSRKLLQASIVLLGGGLNFVQVWQVGRESLAVMLASLAMALLTAALLGRALGVSRNLKTLVGVGTAICGGSAIAAVAPVLQADDHEVSFAISTVFLFNLLAVLVFPAAGLLFGLGQTGFGVWAGTAINDTSSVVAAGYSYGGQAGDIAVITKLARTTMIVPVTLAVALFIAGRAAPAGGKPIPNTGRLALKTFPWFVLGFLLMAVLNSLGAWNAETARAFTFAGKDVLMLLALAAVGLNADLKRIAATGLRPVLLGLGVWVVTAASSLVMQRLLGQI
jgi:uncharacterized integral membrane protein (TIGR00698 family)